MAGLGVLEVSDATFDQEVLQSEQRFGGFPGHMCRSLQGHRPIVEACRN